MALLGQYSRCLGKAVKLAILGHGKNPKLWVPVLGSSFQVPKGRTWETRLWKGPKTDTSHSGLMRGKSGHFEPFWATLECLGGSTLKGTVRGSDSASGLLRESSENGGGPALECVKCIFILSSSERVLKGGFRTSLQKYPFGP